jgi:hypothetical protein
MEKMDTETPTSRGRFLKRLGVTVAAAVGAGALAKNAFASELCCANSSCGSCSGGFFCSCSCSGCVAICLAPGQCTACPC